MTRRSTLPDIPNLDPELARWLESLDRRQLDPITDLAAGATAADIVTAFNALLAEMRLRKAMGT